jgi:hypothetical protein
MLAHLSWPTNGKAATGFRAGALGAGTLGGSGMASAHPGRYKRGS